MKEETRIDYTERILKVQQHIQQHIHEKLNIFHLADIACLSPFHFHRIYKGQTGESVKSYVRRLKLQTAGFQLKNTTKLIADIALEADYENTESFTRAFAKQFGMSPSKFRETTADTTSKRFETEQIAYSAERITITQIPSQKVAYIRHLGDYESVGETWKELYGYAMKSGLSFADNAGFGLVWDDPEVTPQAKLRYDACLPIDKEVKPTANVGVLEVNGGSFAVIRHYGAYKQLDTAYMQLIGRWLPESGKEPREEPVLEFYRNSPWNTKPEDLITDVCLPIS